MNPHLERFGAYAIKGAAYDRLREAALMQRCRFG
jgi:Leu/Phe-tRNA-protein transferase